MTSTAKERPRITFKGNPITLVGDPIQVGQKAPDFSVLAQDLSPITLKDFSGGTLLISAVPSLDTAVCDLQTKRFNEEVAKLDGVQLLTVSMDLPFAQKRWCGAAGLSSARTGSDHREASFGVAYGALIKELRLLTRSVFVIDAQGVVKYVEYVPEVTTHPDYDAALTAAT